VVGLGGRASGRLGRPRCVVERSLAWLVGYRRLQVRYERRADILLGLLPVAATYVATAVVTGLDQVGVLPNAPGGLLQRIMIITSLGWCVAVAGRLLVDTQPRRAQVGIRSHA
jgi:hypothetical protein